MADFNPFQQFGGLQDTAGMNEYRMMRMMSMSDRMQRADVPHMRTPGVGHGGGIGGNPMLANMLSQQAGEPDYSQFTYNPQMKAAG
jgi:hypothetical protein